MADDAEDAYLSPPVQRAARLLRHIAEGDPVTNMARTARELGINRTTLLRLLHTLEAERFIEPRGTDIPGWRIGLGLIGSSIARAARRMNAAGEIVAADASDAVRARVLALRGLAASRRSPSMASTARSSLWRARART